MQELIERFKNIRKRNFINAAPKGQYAFVGIGNHSISNLYPIINYLRVDLKYIVTHTKANAKLISDNFNDIIGTDNFDKVLNDNDINGIFIAANPLSHYKLVKLALLSNKNVFVEKPPCITLVELSELIECEKKSKCKCFVGLQKRYAPVNVDLKKRIKGRCTYNYRYLTGAYPEGNPVFDLFIHPISLLSYLFGKIELMHFSVQNNKSGQTLFLNLSHPDGSIGTVELSTNYSWFNALEHLVVNTDNSIYEMKDTEDLSITNKQGTILSIPKEKLFGGKTDTVFTYKRNNNIPVTANNQIYCNGYFSEINNFINYNENKSYTNNATLSDCVDIYEILEKLKK